MSTTPTRYFGGDSARGGRVRLLNATTFDQVVSRYFNVPVVFNMTREALLSHPDRDRIKDGPYVVPCSYPFDEGSRTNDGAAELVLVTIDLDGGQFVRDFFESPETLRTALDPLCFVAHTTAKHTRDNPRLRIVVPVKPCPTAFLRPLVREVARRLGLPPKFPGFKESTVVSQPAYRPMQFLGEEYGAVIASRTDGEELLIENLSQEVLSETEEARTYASDEDMSGLDLASLPVPGVTVDDLREPLNAIDPDCDYFIWTQVAAALKNQFPDEDDAREAFLMWNEWSSGGTKYRGEKATWYKWRSFKPFARNRRSITVRSLFHYAQEAGWDNTRVAGKVQLTLSEWIEACEDGSVLMLDGPKRIAALPFKNPVIEEALVNELRARIKAVSKQSIDKATILKAVRKERGIAKAEADDGDLEPWLRQIKFIGPSNTFRNAVNGVEYSPAAFDNTFSCHLMPKEADSDAAAPGRPLVLPTHHALNVRKIDRVDGVTYDPRHGGDEIIFEFEGKRYLNEYRKSTVPVEDATRGPSAYAMVEQLLAIVIGRPEYERILLDFLAHNVQYPGVKIRWCPLIQGGHGAGKGTIGVILAAAIGKANYTIISPSTMSSDFNSWRYGHLFAELDELKSPGHNRNEVSNKLKDAITNDRVSVNRKFKDPTVVINVTNFMATTNFFDCITVEDSDRRYFILRSPIQTRRQATLIKSSKLFDRIYRMAEEHPGAFRHALVTHTIAPDFPVNGPAPETEYRQDMIDASKSNYHAEIDKVIDSGTLPTVQRDVILLADLEAAVWSDPRRNAPAWQYLRQKGYNTINGSGVWTHPDLYTPAMGDPRLIITARQEAGELDI
jgi:hypothetical protein